MKSWDYTYGVVSITTRTYSMHSNYPTNIVVLGIQTPFQTSEIWAPPSGQPSRAILLIKSPEVGVVTSTGATCYSISYTFLSNGRSKLRAGRLDKGGVTVYILLQNTLKLEILYGIGITKSLARTHQHML